MAIKFIVQTEILMRVKRGVRNYYFRTYTWGISNLLRIGHYIYRERVFGFVLTLSSIFLKTKFYGFLYKLPSKHIH